MDLLKNNCEDISEIWTSMNTVERKLKDIDKKWEVVQSIKDSCKLLEVREQKLEDHIGEIEDRA
jgi:hypothetical protein